MMKEKIRTDVMIAMVVTGVMIAMVVTGVMIAMAVVTGVMIAMETDESLVGVTVLMVGGRKSQWNAHALSYNHAPNLPRRTPPVVRKSCDSI